MGFNLEPGVPRIAALHALSQFALHELGCLHFEMMDRQLSSGDLEGSEVHSRSYNGFEIDLALSEDELFTRMDPSCRQCIRKAIRSGVKIEEVTDSDFATDYYGQLQDVFAKQRLTPTYDIGRVRTLIRHLQPTGNLLLLRARDSEGRAIATGIFPAMHERAYFWGAASWRPFQILRPNELLLWHAMLYWKQRGVRFFDMGGGGEYKRKYGGHEISVAWLHHSRNSVLPIMRQTAAAFVRTRQRLGIYWSAGSRQSASPLRLKNS
jgi:hypothetical protein